jgi:hypothetical protein
MPGSIISSSFVDSDFTRLYPNSILPETIDNSQRESNGLLKQATVNTIIANLKKNNIIPDLLKKPTEPEYKNKMDTFFKKSKEEYDYYSIRYNTALSFLLSNIKNGYTTRTSETETAVKKYLSYAQIYNKKLNDLLQIHKNIADDMDESSVKMNQSIKEFNDSIKGKKEKLEYQGNIIKSSEGASKLHKEMVKYTEEKTRYTDNLLKMYSFLNIVAFGLLVYIYRAAN